MVNYRKLIQRVDVSKFPSDIELAIDQRQLLVTLKGVTCINTGKPLSLQFHRAFLDTEDTQEALLYIYWNIQEALMHELAECFRVNGKVKHDPHLTEEGRKAMLLGPPIEDWRGRAKRAY